MQQKVRGRECAQDDSQPVINYLSLLSIGISQTRINLSINQENLIYAYITCHFPRDTNLHQTAAVIIQCPVFCFIVLALLKRVQSRCFANPCQDVFKK